MEIGVDPAIPTYAGGLGVLAGDTLRAAADLALPLVGVSLLHRKGYFRQRLDKEGNQTETPCDWNPEKVLEPLPARVSIELEGRTVRVGVWRFLIRGTGGGAALESYGDSTRRPRSGAEGVVPVYFLDTDLPENTPWHRSLCGALYGTDLRYRFCQEAVLGLGGVAVLRAIGHESIRFFHMNEGHSALLTLALLEERLPGRRWESATETDLDAVRRQCVFTTHTPVPAGHDQFPCSMVAEVLGRVRSDALDRHGWCDRTQLNMTHLALMLSDYVNGVAMRHGEVSQDLFPETPIESITNGVHAGTWASPSFAALFDRYLPAWRGDNSYLRYAIRIPPADIHQAHVEAKAALLAEVERRTHVRLDPNALTLGFARRATAYKRADLLFTDLNRLRSIASQHGRLQLVFAGKAHPNDEPGKHLIRRIFQASAALSEAVPVVYLEEYDMALAKTVCAGVDVWLNTPQQPLEASGTSGMKAAVNGVPSLSVLDGWWVEGHVEGVTGWSIGGHWEDLKVLPYEASRRGEACLAPTAPSSWAHNDRRGDEVRSLYDKLEQTILPLYFQRPEEFDRIRQSTIVVNGSFFNAHRMMNQYIRNAYRE
ncbi:MAG: alpha-glucan family phosphorylase [Nitrospirae bacterium]|nr:alpha-glucan family phosphorylase [Nitrospirota bacterium]